MKYIDIIWYIIPSIPIIRIIELKTALINNHVLIKKTSSDNLPVFYNIYFLKASLLSKILCTTYNTKVRIITINKGITNAIVVNIFSRVCKTLWASPSIKFRIINFIYNSEDNILLTQDCPILHKNIIGIIDDVMSNDGYQNEKTIYFHSLEINNKNLLIPTLTI